MPHKVIVWGTGFSVSRSSNPLGGEDAVRSRLVPALRMRDQGGPRVADVRTVLTACALALACAGDAPTSLLPDARVCRLGATASHHEVGAVAKPVLAPSSGGHVLAVDERCARPGARLVLSAALPEGGLPHTPCSAWRVFANGEREQIAKLALRPAGWSTTTVADVDLSGAQLALRCGREGVDGIWALPRVVLPRARAPLIVLMSLDTLRADHVAGFGGRVDLTPTLARLGDEGVRMVATAAEGSWTLPSHLSLFQSRLRPPPQGEAHATLPELLAAEGFWTAAVTGGGWMSPALNFHLGFDAFAARYTRNGSDLPRVLEQADQWLADSEGVPTFLFLHTYAVHRRFPPRAGIANGMSGRGGYPGPQERARGLAAYGLLVRRMDEQLAPWFEALRRAGGARPVLLVVVSDHGEGFGEHGFVGHGRGSPQQAARPHRIRLHDELVHVPLIAWAPGLVPAGRSSARPTNLSDVAPTILSAAGVPVPPAMLGADLWGYWRGQSDAPESIGSVSWLESGAALRDAGHKLIAEQPRAGARPHYELYDLSRDAAERDDLAERDPERVRAMAEHLERRLAEPGGAAASESREAPRLDPETREQLRALGYLGDE